MPLNAGEVVRVATRLRGPQGQDIVNVYYYKATDNINESNPDILQGIAAQMDRIYEVVESEFPATSTPVDIKADVVDIVNGKVRIVRNLGTRPWGDSFQPSGIGNVYAPAVAVGILLRTFAGKVFARKFIGPLMEETFGDHGRLSSNKVSLFVSMLTRMLESIAFGTSRLQPGVLSKRTNNFVAFLFGELAGEAFYQRRRSIRMGS